MVLLERKGEKRKEKQFSCSLSAKNQLGKSFMLCPEYNNDLKTGTLRDFKSEGTERVIGPWVGSKESLLPMILSCS